MALAFTESLNLYSGFSAKARAPNHPKVTGALAYNAKVTGAGAQRREPKAATLLASG